MQIQQLTEIIQSEPQKLLDDLCIEGKLYNNKLSNYCVVHSGDNPSAMTIDFDNDRWACWTHNCHKSTYNSIIGFTRLLLSSRYCGWKRKGDQLYSFGKTLEYIKGLYGIEGKIKFNPADKDKQNFIRNCQTCPEKEVRNICTREQYLRAYQGCPDHFLNRGFSYEILDKYDVRYCNYSRSKYYTRTLVPVYDDENRYVIGISSRKCIEDDSPKWKFNFGFPASTTLFNFCYAEEYIRRNKTTILCESPLNVIRLEQAGIHNSVCIWSCNGFNDYKQRLLDKCGVMKLVLALDNDDNRAGQKAAENIRERYGRFYNIVSASLPTDVNDVADLSVEECKNIFKRYL